MIGDILPPAVAVAEEFGDVPDVVLFPELWHVRTML